MKPEWTERRVKLSVALFILISVTIMSSCGGAKADDKPALQAKKEALVKLQADRDALNAKIEKLQNEISALDPSAVNVKRKLVALDTIELGIFEHYIDLQGKVEGENVAYVAPKGQGGVVKEVYVKQGDQVSKGQLLLKLDDAAERQSLIAAKEQVAGLAAQLEQAKIVFERQQHLWKNNIGTELQVLNAKTALKSLESQYEAAKANQGIAEERLSNTSVRASLSGVVNKISIKVGEFFTAGTQIQLVNNNELKVTVNVPENYSGKIKVGSKMQLSLPDLGMEELSSKVKVVGKLIDPVSRTFYIEGSLPANQAFRPGQVAVARIKDYEVDRVVTIPVNTIQNDEKGKYVMVASGQADKMVAKKKYITIGQMYHDQLEVKSGLQTGDLIIREGFQSLYDGQPITAGN